jgi:uncharacterized protein YggE
MKSVKAFFLCGLLLCMTCYLSAEENEDRSVLEISETASIKAMPNLAHVSFAVETNAAEAQEAIQLNARHTDKVLSTLKESIGPDDSLSTTGFNLSPVYARREPSQLVSYRVKNSVTLTTRDVAALGSLLDKAVKAGASRIDSLSFANAQEQDLGNKAAVKALQRARKTAEQLAQAAGMRVKRILRISYSPPGPVRRYARMAMAEGGSTPIEAGELSVTASVRVEFEIE